MDVKEVREALAKLHIAAPDDGSITQEALDALILDVLDDITDENIEEKLAELDGGNE